MDKKTEMRLGQLSEMDLVYDGSSYIGYGGNEDINFHYTEISFDSDTEWNRKVQDVRNEIKRRSETVKV
jgi:hypothetical protein